MELPRVLTLPMHMYLLQVNKASVLEEINREVSRIAGKAYAEDGSSLYDGVRITSADSPVIEQLIVDAFTMFLRRGWDFAVNMPHMAYLWKHQISGTQTLQEDKYTEVAQPTTSDILYDLSGGESDWDITTGYSSSTIVVTSGSGTSAVNYTYKEDGERLVASLDLPDFDEDHLGARASDALSRYIVMYATSKWFEERLSDKADKAAQSAKEALDSAIEFFKTRTPLTRNN